MFELHPQLTKDCVDIGCLELCQVLLLNDSHYPWVILVPQREGVTEIYQLDDADQVQLMVESSAVAKAMADFFQADKMNMAALGNQVPQLHIHHIVRYKSDLSWPKPVWGAVEASAYEPDELKKYLQALRELLLD